MSQCHAAAVHHSSIKYSSASTTKEKPCFSSNKVFKLKIVACSSLLGESNKTAVNGVAFAATTLQAMSSCFIFQDISLSRNDLNHTWIFQWLINLSRNGNKFVHLDLSENSLSGPLPSAFGEMYTLSSLCLSYNQLEGLVPDYFLNLTSLRVLDLSSNNFQGLFPFALSKLRSPRALSNGSFSKNLSNNICNLQELHLDDNNFGDDLSNVIHILSVGCANKPCLESLKLGMNKFWGYVPDIINTFSSIRELRLNDNLLNGTISQGIGQLSMLEILDVSNSSLNDTLNHNHFLHLSRLRELHLSDNSALLFTVASSALITKEKHCFNSKKVFNWMFVICSLPGESNKTAVNGVAFAAATLQGQGITSIFELKHLKYLDLSSNDFSDQLIPESIDYLTNLEHLNLSYSGFMGRIPETLGNLTKLASLDLSGNYNYDSRVQSSLRWLSHLSLLEYINLSDIDLSKATNWVQIINNLPFLRTLYMENCQLSSTIPSPLSYINSSTSLKDISLSGNHLNHTWIFQWLFNLSRKGNELVHLDLSHNSFSWPLPSEFGEHDNQLELVLDSFSNLTSLRVLNLSYNNIHGFPYALSNLRSLRVLSLSYNNLHGSFSKNLRCANKPRLQYLDLRMNNFWGSAPDIISTFSSIRELHLSGNYLNGTVSQGIGQLSMLEILDVSNSSLKDTLNHNHFLHLSRLRELYLSDNSALVLNISTGWIPPFQLDITTLRVQSHCFLKLDFIMLPTYT
ncbi:receptor-like protein EIX2 [Beta vulgaris subsp. vulgaris]|uniref:receptor-like protein EIX2 n=1 Tax=Beta vulgaris subsp. vulgaris TaxID=3555 RepID=UPI0020375DFC|nr:receptor-like protein EIX2 [Beta vulgaris subsp. vulgaris]